MVIAVLLSVFWMNSMQHNDGAVLGGNPVTAFTGIYSGTLTQGEGVTATSSGSSATILATDIDDEDAIEVSLPVGAVTLTFPASTTFPLDSRPGATRQFSIFNASTTVGANVTIAGGTGTLLEIASSTIGTGLKVIYPSGASLFTAFRKVNSDIEIFMNPGQ